MKEKDPNSFWYSKLSLAQTCLQKYKFRYVDNVPEPGQKSDALEFGSAMHLGLEAMFEGENGQLTFTTYWDAVDRQSTSWGKFTWEEHRLMGEMLLARFERLHFKHFEPIVAEQRMFTKLGKYSFEGTPDMYGKYKGVITIADFKTSGMRYKTEKLDIAEQLRGYAQLVADAGYEMPTQAMYMVFVKSKIKGEVAPSIQVIKQDLTKEQVSVTMENSLEQIKDLATRTTFPKNYGSCLDYNKKCPYWSLCHESPRAKDKSDTDKTK